MSVVGLFVDAENLVYGYLNRFRAKLDPGKLVEIASEYGTVKCIISVLVTLPIPGLRNMRIVLRLTPLISSANLR